MRLIHLLFVLSFLQTLEATHLPKDTQHQIIRVWQKSAHTQTVFWRMVTQDTCVGFIWQFWLKSTSALSEVHRVWVHRSTSHISIMHVLKLYPLIAENRSLLRTPPITAAAKFRCPSAPEMPFSPVYYLKRHGYKVHPFQRYQQISSLPHPVKTNRGARTKIQPNTKASWAQWGIGALMGSFRDEHVENWFTAIHFHAQPCQWAKGSFY